MKALFPHVADTRDFVRGIRRLPRPAGSRRGVWGEAGIAAVTTPFLS